MSWNTNLCCSAQWKSDSHTIACTPPTQTHHWHICIDDKICILLFCSANLFKVCSTRWYTSESHWIGKTLTDTLLNMKWDFFRPIGKYISDIFSPQLSHFSPCVTISSSSLIIFLLFCLSSPCVPSCCDCCLFVEKKPTHRGNFAGICEQICYDFSFLCIWLSCDCIWVTNTFTTASLSICPSVWTSRIDLPELFGVIETVMHLFSVQWILICSAYEMDL